MNHDNGAATTAQADIASARHINATVKNRVHTTNARSWGLLYASLELAIKGLWSLPDGVTVQEVRDLREETNTAVEFRKVGVIQSIRMTANQLAVLKAAGARLDIKVDPPRDGRDLPERKPRNLSRKQALTG